MTNHTPTTAQVRAAYTRAMRNAFIASSGEHDEEFDRWLAKRDKQVIAKMNSVKCSVEQVDGSCTATRDADASGWEQRVGPKGDAYWACPECIAWLASVNTETVGSAA